MLQGWPGATIHRSVRFSDSARCEAVIAGRCYIYVLMILFYTVSSAYLFMFFFYEYHNSLFSIVAALKSMLLIRTLETDRRIQHGFAQPVQCIEFAQSELVCSLAVTTTTVMSGSKIIE